MSAIPKSWKPSGRDGSSSLYCLIGDFVSQEIAFVRLIKVFVAIVHHGVSISSTVAHDEAGFPFSTNHGGPRAMVGAAPVLVVLATAVMAASDRPCVALLKLSSRPLSSQCFSTSLLLTATVTALGLPLTASWQSGPDQDDAIALAFAGNMSATNLDVGEIAVACHRCQTHVRSHIQFHLPV
jgi:hypothetical protein